MDAPRHLTERPGAEPTRRSGTTDAGRGVVYRLAAGRRDRARQLLPERLSARCRSCCRARAGTRTRSGAATGRFRRVPPELHAQRGAPDRVHRLQGAADPHLAPPGGAPPASCAAWPASCAPARWAAWPLPPASASFAAAPPSCAARWPPPSPRPVPGGPTRATTRRPARRGRRVGRDSRAATSRVGRFHTAMNARPRRSRSSSIRRAKIGRGARARWTAGRHRAGDGEGQAGRADVCRFARHDFHLEIGPTRSWRPRHRARHRRYVRRA